MLERALKVIPLGSQTFSKSYTQYPLGVSPFFATRGRGARLWDPDGNEYVDFVNALAAVTLGYCDPDVDAAVHAQLESGVIFSLPHSLETEVAEAITALVPSAQKVRFGKNGSDAAAGAVRAARAFTARDHIAVCGYHGWQDWYIGTTARNRGVPSATRALTHSFSYNDLESLKMVFAAHKGAIAAIVMEPMNVQWPAAGFLSSVQALAREEGALFILDETITGFRFNKGGAQTLFDLTPDLSIFGKGLGNGFPLSAVAGRADVMHEFEEIFFSFTMGGECLSLAAAKAVLQKLQREPVIETLASLGERVVEGVNALIDKHDVHNYLSITGHPSWTFLGIKGVEEKGFWQIKTLLMQELLKRGILSFGTHNISYAHDDGDIDRLLTVYDDVFAILSEAINNDCIGKYLECQPLKPLFRVR